MSIWRSGWSHIPRVRASVSDAYVQSAHPLMYLIPGYASIGRTGLDTWLAQTVPRARYVNLYLGWSVLVLAMIAAAGAAVSLWRSHGATFNNMTTVLVLYGANNRRGLLPVLASTEGARARTCHPDAR